MSVNIVFEKLKEAKKEVHIETFDAQKTLNQLVERIMKEKDWDYDNMCMSSDAKNVHIQVYSPPMQRWIKMVITRKVIEQQSD